MMATKVLVAVMDYASGEKIGVTTMDEGEWERYAATSHPAYQWPQGIARAGDVLTREQLRECGAGPNTVIWID